MNNSSNLSSNSSTENEFLPQTVPDPEVVGKAHRRRFTNKYKREIVEEANNCSEPGEIGALLRRKGLYSSHLTDWRRLYDEGKLDVAEKKRGRGAKKQGQQNGEIRRLRRENERLENKLKLAETLIEIQKKVSDLMNVETPNRLIIRK